MHWVIVLHLHVGLEGCSQPGELWFVDILMYKCIYVHVYKLEYNYSSELVYRKDVEASNTVHMTCIRVVLVLELISNMRSSCVHICTCIYTTCVYSVTVSGIHVIPSPEIEMERVWTWQWSETLSSPSVSPSIHACMDVYMYYTVYIHVYTYMFMYVLHVHCTCIYMYMYNVQYGVHL